MCECVCVCSGFYSLGPWATFIGLATNFYCPVLVLVSGCIWRWFLVAHTSRLCLYLSASLRLPQSFLFYCAFFGRQSFRRVPQTDCGSNHIAKRGMAATFGIRDAFLQDPFSQSERGGRERAMEPCLGWTIYRWVVRVPLHCSQFDLWCGYTTCVCDYTSVCVCVCVWHASTAAQWKL